MRPVRGKRIVSVLAVGGLALAATACGEAPDESPGGGATSAAPAYAACMVTDVGGIDDRSFNASAWAGLQAGKQAQGNIDPKYVASTAEADYEPNLRQYVTQGCKFILAVGGLMGTATSKVAKETPNQQFAIVDGKVPETNVFPMQFATEQAAFLAGYLAAGYSKTGKVGTYGGMPFPTVTIFMDGFKQGAEYYAKEKKKDVEVVGWDGKNGSFTGGFEANEAATSTAKQILDQDVDVILPVGGPIYQGAITAIEDSGSDIAMVGVDADLFETDPSTQDYVMTSILKGMKVSTYEAVVAAGNDEFDFEPYIGTLENDGVGIAPFHNFEDKVSGELAGELDEVKAGIIDGSIKVQSYLG